MRRIPIGCALLVLAAWTAPACLAQSSAGRSSPRIINVADTVPATPAPAASGIASPTPAAPSAAPIVSPTTPAIPASPSSTSTAGPTAEEIQRRLRTATESADLPAEVKLEVQKQYQNALESIKAVAESAAKTKQRRADVDGAPAALEQARQALAQPVPATPPSLPAAAALTDWEQAAEELKKELERARGELAARESDVKGRDRKAELARLVDEGVQQIEDLRKRAAAPPPEGEHPALTTARRTEVHARRRALEQQVEARRAEVARMDALADLFTLQRDLARRRVTALEQQLAAWQKDVAKRRKEETQQQVDEARRALEQAPPALRELTERNASLVKERQQLATKLDHAAQTVDANRKSLANVKRDWAKAVERIEAAGLTTTVGLMLRKHREQLPNGDDLRQQLRQIQAEMPQVELRTIELKDERDEQGDPAEQTKRRMQQILAALPRDAAERLEPEVLKALTSQRKYRDGLLADYGTYLETLSDQEVSARRLLDQIAAFTNYVDERILWIRSDDMLSSEHAMQAGQALWTLGEPRTWIDTASAALRDLLREPSRSLPLVAFWAALLILQRKLRQRLQTIHQPASDTPFPSFAATAEAIALTVAIGSVWPLLCWFIGWRLTQSEITSPFTVPLGLALKTTAMVLWPAELVRQLFRNGGLVQAHLGWDADVCRLVRVNIRRLMMIGVPLILLVTFFNTVRDGQWRDSLGRSAFIAAMVLLSVILNRLFHHRNHLVQMLLGGNEQNGWFRLRFAIQAAAMAIPLGLALAAAAGYSYSAQQLADRFALTVWYVVGVLIVRGLIARWLFIRQWRLARHRAEQRATAEAEALASGASEVSATQRAVAASQVAQQTREAIQQEDVQSLVHIDLQLQQLLRIAVGFALLVGCWLIWDDMFPALRALNRVSIWPASETAAAPPVAAPAADSAAGKPAAEAAPARAPGHRGTTLADLLLTLLIAVVTVLAGKNIPGLLEILLLERLPLDKGARNALTTICGYGIMFTGLIVGCNAIGLSWQNIQWFAAAMTVGLGFGLQ